MSNPFQPRLFPLVLALALVASGPRIDGQQPVPIPPEVLAQASQSGQARYLVLLRERADLRDAAAMTDRDARGRFVYDALKRTADRSQRAILQFLAAERTAGRATVVRPFLSVNAIGVRSDDRALRRISAFPEVERIVAAPAVSVPAPVAGGTEAAIQGIEWNIASVGAPASWARGITGQGIIVANIDTGVEFAHPALVDQYRGNTGSGFVHDRAWWDATGTCALAPCDDNGHGTHTMGTMVGDDGGANRIGVAPGATWIACKALGAGGSGSLFDLLECGDWILAPWDLTGANPDPTERPHVVNNSWGFSFGGFAILRPMVDSWRAAGIFPAFSVGNSGPSCATATSPGDYPEAFATGALTAAGTLASFSSRGPSAFGPVKPDLAAPGVNVRSSVPPGSYAVFSGTSMASPHTAGLVALLWSEYPNLRRDVPDTERKLRPAARIMNTTDACGGDTPTTHPNNSYGWGSADAVATQKPFSVYTDRALYHTGDTMQALVSLVNPLTAAFTADPYLGVVLPNGETQVFPFGTVEIPASIRIFDVPQFSGSFGGTEPPGQYSWFSLLVKPGTDPNDPANYLSVDVAPFAFVP